MIAAIVVLLLIGWFLASDLFLELATGVALLSIPIAIFQGEWEALLTAAVILACCVYAMARRYA